MTAPEPVEAASLREKCLDCALFDCDRCADSWGDGLGCCCGRVRPDDEGDDDD